MRKFDVTWHEYGTGGTVKVVTRVVTDTEDLHMCDVPSLHKEMYIDSIEEVTNE